MKKRLVSLVASLSLALGLAPAFAKDSSYEARRAEQYREYYKDYHDKDYKIRKTGIRTEWDKNDTKIVTDWLEIEHGNNLHDNLRPMFSRHCDFYLSQIDKEYHNYTGPDSDWYLSKTTDFNKNPTATPLESLDQEELPQVIKDVLKLPKDMQKEIFAVVFYPIDGDSWIMLPSDTGPERVREIYARLNAIDEARDVNLKKPEGQIQPVIPTKNQFLPMDIFFPPVRYVDANNDGKADYVVELYCTNGTWFDEDAEIKYIDLTQWFELHQDGPNEGLRMYEKPFKITIDFDIGKEYEEEGYDIRFFDEDHDGFFERYELLEKKK